MPTWQPLGHRILIKPDEQATESASGLILPDDRDHVPVSGTVIAVGLGPKRDQRVRLASISRCIAIVDELAEMGVREPQEYRTELERYRNEVERFEGSLQVGDRVVYPEESGLLVTDDDRPFIVMQEDEVAIVAIEEQVAA
jgi:co-chaperonin GroES (HSP10)